MDDQQKSTLTKILLSSLTGGGYSWGINFLTSHKLFAYANIFLKANVFVMSYSILVLLMHSFVWTMFILLILDECQKLLLLHSRKTYDDMEAKSQQLWTMQRYVLMGSILSQSIMPATLSIFPLIYQCFQHGFRRLYPNHGHEDSPKHKPFRERIL